MIEMIHRLCGPVADDPLLIDDPPHTDYRTAELDVYHKIPTVICRSCMLYRWWTVSEQQSCLLHPSIGLSIHPSFYSETPVLSILWRTEVLEWDSGYNNEAVQKHASPSSLFFSLPLSCALLHYISVWLYTHWSRGREGLRHAYLTSVNSVLFSQIPVCQVSWNLTAQHSSAPPVFLVIIPSVLLAKANCKYLGNTVKAAWMSETCFQNYSSNKMADYRSFLNDSCLNNINTPAVTLLLHLCMCVSTCLCVYMRVGASWLCLCVCRTIMYLWKDSPSMYVTGTCFCVVVYKKSPI